MESSAASFVARTRSSRERRQSLVPSVVFAILAISAALAPPVLFAAETPVATQQNSVVVFMVIILLFGSMVAGLIFASPLRRRLIRTPGSNGAGEASLARHAWPGPGRRAADHDVVRPVAQTPAAQPTYTPAGYAMETRTVAYDPSARYAPQQPNAEPSYPQPAYAQPVQPARPSQPAPTHAAWPPSPAPAPHAAPAPQPPAAQAPASPRPTPWSTSRPQTDSNWDPTRR